MLKTIRTLKEVLDTNFGEVTQCEYIGDTFFLSMKTENKFNNIYIIVEFIMEFIPKTYKYIKKFRVTNGSLNFQASYNV